MKNIYKAQSGVALAISLIFLVMITIIGLMSIRGVAMNELISSNVQQKRTTFQVSESIIESVWTVPSILANTPEELIDPPASLIDKTPNKLPFSTLFDIPALGSSSAIDINGVATIQYCEESHNTLGESQGIGDNDGTTVSHIYSIHGQAELSATKTSSDHDQRGFIKRPAVGRTGNCT